MRLLIFLKSTSSLSFPLGFCCANIGNASFEKSKTVKMSSLCMNANSTKNSSLGLIVKSQLWLHNDFFVLGSELTLNSWLNPKSTLRRAKISRYFMSACSVACFSSTFKREPVQLFLSKNICFHCWSPWWISCSSSCGLYYSSKTLRCKCVMLVLVSRVFRGRKLDVFCGWVFHLYLE